MAAVKQFVCATTTNGFPRKSTHVLQQKGVEAIISYYMVPLFCLTHAGNRRRPQIKIIDTEEAVAHTIYGQKSFFVSYFIFFAPNIFEIDCRRLRGLGS